MQMLLKCEIVEIAKQLRNIDFRNFIKFKSNSEILHEFFLKKFTNKLVLLLNEYNFEIKYKNENFHSINESFRYSNYKNENENNNICLFILQNKFRNIAITNIAFLIKSK